MRSDLTDVEVLYCHSTAKALAVWADEDARKRDDVIWIPLSLCEFTGNATRGGVIELTAPRGILEEKGLV